MTGNRTSPSLITDILDVLDRHGYTHGDDQHTARAIGLISDLAHIYEGSLDHPFGPVTVGPCTVSPRCEARGSVLFPTEVLTAAHRNSPAGRET